MCVGPCFSATVNTNIATYPKLKEGKGREYNSEMMGGKQFFEVFGRIFAKLSQNFERKEEHHKI